MIICVLYQRNYQFRICSSIKTINQTFRLQVLERSRQHILHNQGAFPHSTFGNAVFGSETKVGLRTSSSVASFSPIRLFRATEIKTLKTIGKLFPAHFQAKQKRWNAATKSEGKYFKGDYSH
jgi:hypothetical protein